MPNCLGNFVTVDSKLEVTLQLSDALLIVQYNTNNAMMCRVNGPGTTGQLRTQWHISPMLETFSEIKETRPMRTSIRIRNVSARDHVQGTAYALLTDQSVAWQTTTTTDTVTGQDYPSHITQAMWDQLKNATTTSVAARALSNFSLQTSSQWDCYPAHYAGLTKFTPYEALAQPYGDYDWNHKLVEGARRGATQNGIATFLFYVPPTTDPQTFHISIASQIACTFPANTLGHSLARPPPRSEHDVFDAAVRDARMHGSNPSTPG